MPTNTYARNRVGVNPGLCLLITVLSSCIFSSTSVLASDLAFTTGTVVVSSITRPHRPQMADLDGDGDLDIVHAGPQDNTITWHENLGYTPLSFASHVVTTQTLKPYTVCPADLDGDGRLDLVSASATDNQIAWYQNDGAHPPHFTQHVISLQANGAFGLCVADVNGDGHPDPISGSVADAKVAWYENSGSANPQFTEHVIMLNVQGPTSVAAGDLDGDGDCDILSADYFSNKISWYENRGGLSPVLVPHTLDANVPQSQFVQAADVDGDGDLDVLTVSHSDNLSIWYENDGARPPSFTRHILTTDVVYPMYLSPADLDKDGDTDLILTAQNVGSGVYWLENDGARPPNFTLHLINKYIGSPGYALVADMNRDGTRDLIITSYSGNKIYCIFNLTGAVPRSSIGNAVWNAYR